ncbi:hypothetical protein Taro_049759 [Colocasia esculenta]|uniref:Uncharacterized protein n=1 Tax=Colocasia esculenta TaxID=4460 RepID=A0A843XBM0_COLES|nr:hypothetical protein [Colocasia esculenta]
MLTSALKRRRPTPLRSGPDGGVHRILNRKQFITQVGQTELSELCLAREKNCCRDLRRFSIWKLFSAWSRREDVARSRGDAGLYLIFAFFMKLVCGSRVVDMVFTWFVRCVHGLCARGE